MEQFDVFLQLYVCLISKYDYCDNSSFVTYHIHPLKLCNAPL